MCRLRPIVSRPPPNGVFVHSGNASAQSTALSMSSGSYSGLAMNELIQRKRKKFMTAPKFSSSGKAEQYVIPLVIEQLRWLTKSSKVVRNVLSIACISGDWIAQWLANLSSRPCGFRGLACEWFRANSLKRSWRKSSVRARRE